MWRHTEQRFSRRRCDATDPREQIAMKGGREGSRFEVWRTEWDSVPVRKSGICSDSH